MECLLRNSTEFRHLLTSLCCSQISRDFCIGKHELQSCKDLRQVPRVSATQQTNQQKTRALRSTSQQNRSLLKTVNECETAIILNDSDMAKKECYWMTLVWNNNYLRTSVLFSLTAAQNGDRDMSNWNQYERRRSGEMQANGWERKHKNSS